MPSCVAPGAINTSFPAPVNAHVNMSKLAQESMREIKRLRILLIKLLSNVPSPVENENETNSVDMDPQCTSDGDGPPVTPIATSGFQDGPLITVEKELDIPISSITLQVRSSFENLDKLAFRMHNLRRASGRCMEVGLQNSLNLLTKLDQLEFPSVNDPNSDTHSATGDPRRVDWLSGRSDAERWSSKYWERTRTVLEGLLSCSVFRRSNLNLDAKRRRENLPGLASTATTASDSRVDLEHLLNEIHNQYPKLTITLLEPGSNVNIVHVKVGDVMQCFVTFRRLHPESIIVRGLNEPMLNHSISSQPTSSKLLETEQPVSKPTEELLQLLRSKSENFAVDSRATKELLLNLLDPKTPPTEGRQGRRGTVSAQRTFLSWNLADLVTPSRLGIFQRISQLARCSLLYFSNDYQPSMAVRGLFAWLNSYQDLFTAPCRRCGQLIGQDVSLPVWRGYPHTRRDTQPMEAQHEHCQAIV